LGKNSEADAYDGKNNLLLVVEQVDKDCNSLYMYHKFNYSTTAVVVNSNNSNSVSTAKLIKNF